MIVWSQIDGCAQSQFLDSPLTILDRQGNSESDAQKGQPPPFYALNKVISIYAIVLETFCTRSPFWLALHHHDNAVEIFHKILFMYAINHIYEIKTHVPTFVTEHVLAIVCYFPSLLLHFINSKRFHFQCNCPSLFHLSQIC